MRIKVLSLLFILMVSVFSTASGSENTDTDYRVGDGDILRILVYDHPDLTTNSRITNGGKISVPLIGFIDIGGMTVSQVAREVAKHLSKGYVVNPQVSVFVEEFRSQRVVIMGQVTTPGLYELSGPTSVLELISKAGGLREQAGDVVIVKRKAGGSGEERQITVNLRDLLNKGDTSLDIPVMEGDSLFVPEAGLYYVTGQVNRPNAYKHEQGTTVIKAITMAGGFTNLASTRRVRIIRTVDGVEQVLQRVSMHDSVQPNDVIVVPESFF